MNNIKFYTFEGGEGSGKTTVITEIKNKLESIGNKVMITREPGGVEIAEQIRNVILDKENTKMDYKTEMLLYAAARREHLVHKVKKALEEGYIVLCDRFVDSSLVYQGYVRGLGFDLVWNVNNLIIDDIMPKLTLYLDVDPIIGLERINNNINREKNRLDLENLDFHMKVRDGYKKLLKKFPDRIKEIDASKSLDNVIENTFNTILYNLREE